MNAFIYELYTDLEKSSISSSGFHEWGNIQNVAKISF